MDGGENLLALMATSFAASRSESKRYVQTLGMFVLTKRCPKLPTP